MTHFAIAGIQMFLHHGSNIDAMRHRLDLTMHLYPWVNMVMFSELAVFGPMLQYAQPLPGQAGRCIKVKNVPAYSPKHLEELHQFTSVLTVTYRLAR